jgi:hypothetical protein
MLDRAKVMRELSEQTGKVFVDHTDEYRNVVAEWEKLAADPFFLQKVEAFPSYSLSTWQAGIADTHAVIPFSKPYQVVSIDGSQIYPDKHQGTSCFLINIGTVILRYGQRQGSTFFSSEPFLFVGQDADDDMSRSVDVVNGKREEFEFKTGLDVCSSLKNEYLDMPLLFLFDGSLIFWHLESKEMALKQYFLERYCAILQGLYEQSIPVMGYISLPKSKDLVNLVRAHYTQFAPVLADRTQHFPHTTDALIARSFLEVGERSTLFESHVPITGSYPEHLRPWFCYYATQAELVRIEFPQYVVEDSALFEESFSIVADQVLKGNGYPISTAEAHMQAVVKGADRDFFYHALEKYSVHYKQRLIMSQKHMKKRKMSI